MEAVEPAHVVWQRSSKHSPLQSGGNGRIATGIGLASTASAMLGAAMRRRDAERRCATALTERAAPGCCAADDESAAVETPLHGLCCWTSLHIADVQPVYVHPL
jgi:hypothetical protein